MPTKQVSERRGRAIVVRGDGSQVMAHRPSREAMMALVSEDIQRFIRADLKGVEKWLKRQEGLYKTAMRNFAPPKELPPLHPRDLIARGTKVPQPISPSPAARIESVTQFCSMTRRSPPYRDLIGVPSTFRQVPCSPAYWDAVAMGAFIEGGTFPLSANVGSFYGSTCAGTPWLFGEQNVATAFMLKEEVFDPPLNAATDLYEAADLRVPMAPHVTLFGGEGQFGYAGFYGVATLTMVGITASGVQNAISRERFAFGIEAGISLASPEYLPTFTLNSHLVSSQGNPILAYSTIVTATLGVFLVANGVIADASMLGNGALVLDELRTARCVRDTSSTL